MKNQGLFSSKDKSKKLKCRLLQFLFGALRVNVLLCKKNSLTVFDNLFLHSLFAAYSALMLECF